MTFRVSLLFQADAKAAKAEVDGLASSARKVGEAAQDMGRKATDGARGVDSIGRAADGAEAQLQGLTAAQQTNAAATTQLTSSHRMAAGATGNLVAQFNDIGMMLAAGQNPLQLAIQQGSQITQVIGPMGAAGAARALGSAFVGMLSPINLITIGAIAVGAAMIQWLTGAGKGAVQLSDLIEESADAIDAFAAASERARASTTELIEQFGSADPALLQVLEDLAGIARLEAWRSIDAVTESLRDMVTTASGGITAQSDIQDFLGLGSIGSESRQAAAIFQSNLVALSEAAEPADRLRAALDLREQLLENTGGIEGMTDAQLEFYKGVAETIAELRLLGVEIDKAAAAGPDWASSADAGLNAARVALMREVAAAEADAARAAARRQVEDEASARALLQTMAEQATLATLIARYGEDSAEVAAERAAQERRAFEAMLATSTASEELKDQLRLSFDIMQMMAGVDLASGIAAAASTAATLAQNMNISLAAASALLSMGGGTEPVIFDPRDPNYDPVAAEMARLQGEYGRVSPFDASRLPQPSGGSPGGGGGTDPAEEAARLMEQLQDRTDALLGRLDPLVAATEQYEEAQNTLNDAWEAGIITADEHAAAMAKVNEEYAAAQAEASGAAQAWQFVGETGNNVLMDIASGAMTLEEAALRAASALAEAVLQGALLGEGPFGELFGGSSIVDLLVGSIGGGAAAPIPGKAGGGMIHGPGDGTSDDVLMYGSSGEFVVTAEATSRYRPVLEAMNAGAPLPHFARGGLIGGGSDTGRSNTAAAPSGSLTVNLDLRGTKGSAEIEAATLRGMQALIDQYDAYRLPVSIRRIGGDRKRIG